MPRVPLAPAPCVQARLDAGLHARVVEIRPLLYAAGPDAALDRPGHVRAGSSLAWLGAVLAVVQDDAAFLALVEPDGGDVRVVTLPAGPGGARLFDEGRGNKALKADGEACFSLPTADAGGARLFVLGSGSRPERERVLVIDDLVLAPERARVHTIDASSFYSSLRACPAFAGSELNLEGAVVAGEVLRLLQRGNGAPRDGIRPVDAIGDVALDAFLDYVARDGRAEPPPLVSLTPYELGTLSGARLTFTDGVAIGDDGILYVAAAETSPDTYHDGEVRGVAIGEIRRDHARFAPLLGPDGEPYLGKAEGIALAREAGQAWVVVDRDDPARPAELCRVKLEGFAI